MSESLSHATDGCLSAQRFYSEFYGHRVRDLEIVRQQLRRSSERLIWTAGDSSLDNKYWFSDTAAAVNGYQHILRPPRMKQDVTYWLNYLAAERQGTASSSSPNTMRTAAINTAVEATTLNERTFRLRPQDIFLRDNLQADDILIVSVGGNDVALCPSPCTIASMVGLVCCCPIQCIRKGFSCGALPCDDYCWGCGPSVLSCGCAMPPCLGYLNHVFSTRLQLYIEKLTSRTKPSMVLVCMIYYPDEMPGTGWAGPALAALGYDNNPAKLQAIIATGYREALARIHIQGTHVVPVPLFQVLDGKNTNDYIQRVEPSPEGGRKMAEFLLDAMDHSTVGGTAIPLSDPATPTTAFMRDR